MSLTLDQGLLRLAEEPLAASLISPRLDLLGTLLTRYIEEIELFNPAYGLVGAKNREDLVIRHILDSLAPLGIILRLLTEGSPPGEPSAGRTGGPNRREPGDLTRQSPGDPAGRAARIADIGSGAGLPGIPLAIALPQVHVTLIERMGRRAAFLRNTIAVLGLGNAAVEEVEMERAEPGRFDLLCFRALRPLEPPLLRALRRLLAPGGVIAAYKGRPETIRTELAGDWAGPWDSLPCPVPGLEEERHLVVLRGAEQPGVFQGPAGGL